MSTNYYWAIPVPDPFRLPTGELYEYQIDRAEPRFHLGKYTGGKFIWAQDPKIVVAACHSHEEIIVVEDEYGGVYTGKLFLEVVSGGVQWETHSIGKVFS